MSEEHEKGSGACSPTGGQNGGTQVDQRVLGPSVAIHVPRKFTIGMGEVKDKVATQANEDGKAETFTVVP
jgi:hypothetical protein